MNSGRQLKDGKVFIMNRKTAVLLFLGICVALAALLVMGMITPFIGGAIFAVALVMFGGLSKGFRRK
jgi:hypothetical protein